MNLDRGRAVALAQQVVAAAPEFAGKEGEASPIDLLLCPPFVYLEAVAEVVRGSRVALGAQNAYFEREGAFTGEIAPGMLVDVGCQAVILGHSERRHILGETDQMISKKVHAALAAGLMPIVCVGETLAQREAGETQQVIRTQLDGSLAGVTAEGMARVVIAYEPVWAIGTGRVATPEQAGEVHDDLRKVLCGRYNDPIGRGMRILYGGSVKADNAGSLLAQPNVDGALVGGASLKADEFLGIAAAGRAVKPFHWEHR